MAWHARCGFGSRVYAAEDVITFYALKSQLYRSFHDGTLGWWNPASGLGMPRLGDIEAGWLSPLSLLFYLVPTETALSLYPSIIFPLLGLATYALFRSGGASPLAALFGSMSWVSMGTITSHVQDPSVMETFLWLPVALLCWQRWRGGGSPAWLALGSLAVAFQCCGGFPQYMLYNTLVEACWVGVDLMRDPARRLQRAAVAAGMVGAGLLLASFQLLATLELAHCSQRNLLNASSFADTFRFSGAEAALSYCGEAFWFMAPRMLTYGAPFYNAPTISFIVVIFAALAAARARRWAEWAVVAVFTLGTLGSAGLVMPVISHLLPVAGMLRSPCRMIVPAVFFLSWLAAVGMDDWQQEHPVRTRLSVAALGWLLATAWIFHRDQFTTVPASSLLPPPAVRSAESRCAFDFRPQFSDWPPYGLLQSASAAGVNCLFVEGMLMPANYFEAMFASQLGTLSNPQKLQIVVSNKNFMPLLHPDIPLMRAFHLRTLLQVRQGQVHAVAMSGPPTDWLVPVTLEVASPAARWRLAASSEWDETHSAIVEPGVASGLPRGGPAGGVRVISAGVDREELEVSGEGGLLLSSALFYPGWQVNVDGAAALPLQADVALRAVAVPPGTHRVVWRYRPTWLTAAICCSLGGCLWLLGVLVTAARWRSARAAPACP